MNHFVAGQLGSAGLIASFWVDLSAQHGGVCRSVLGEPARRLLQCIAVVSIDTGSP